MLRPVAAKYCVVCTSSTVGPCAQCVARHLCRASVVIRVAETVCCHEGRPSLYMRIYIPIPSTDAKRQLVQELRCLIKADAPQLSRHRQQKA